MSVRTQAPSLPTASVCQAAAPRLGVLNLGLEENQVSNSKFLAFGTIETPILVSYCISLMFSNSLACLKYSKTCNQDSKMALRQTCAPSSFDILLYNFYLVSLIWGKKKLDTLI